MMRAGTGLVWHFIVCHWHAASLPHHLHRFNLRPPFSPSRASSPGQTQQQGHKKWTVTGHEMGACGCPLTESLFVFQLGVSPAPLFPPDGTI
ncbi:hypothetical protein EJ05DRAFT_474465 [Pseudovirgaria hyperparasitica]|uniref:Secreted protein n=1 Tax=Pseudovirgaria hyperparasitica TaxID=470096 RepID=A0A6A6WG59_9PEZI|nr:uncharacterized protein EJ05DRAFT_474465 [Pseudovirgaria hyperparasitica]KAF2760607.1 hypothetical protein EJ05DRAFT_474465 [Pseudovirgaria hyperparasitica]